MGLYISVSTPHASTYALEGKLVIGRQPPKQLLCSSIDAAAIPLTAIAVANATGSVGACPRLTQTHDDQGWLIGWEGFAYIICMCARFLTESQASPPATRLS